MMPLEAWLIIGPTAAALTIPASKFVVKAVAAAIVKEINGSLGLDGIRNDVSLLKGQVQNLEGQLEVILTDL
jgi:hypothetical protein